MADELSITVPSGPAGQFRERLAEQTAEHPGFQAVERAVAELVAQLAPGALGNADASGTVKVKHPGRSGGVATATISVKITLPKQVGDDEPSQAAERKAIQ